MSVEQKIVSTQFIHNYFPFSKYTDLFILILRHDVKIYVLRSDIQSVKYAKIRASSGLYFPIYDSVLVRENKNMILFIYKENTDRRKPTFQHISRSD